MRKDRVMPGALTRTTDAVSPGSVSDQSDDRLLGLVGSGDREAFRILWDRFGVALYTICLRRLSDQGAAEDATQEAFTSVWRRASTFDPTRGSAAGWLYAVARNAAAQLVRRGQAGATLTVLDEQTADAEYDPVISLAVHAALTRLPATEREVLELAYFEDMTQTEIA